MRALLLKRKIDMEQDRKDQEHNQSATVSYMDSSGASNLSAASFMSATTNATK